MMNLPTYVPHRDHDVRITSATKAIHAILPLDLYPAHKRELLSVCFWKITEADGKFKVRYWSKGSLENPQSKIHHEHVNERRALIKRLLDGEDVNSVIADAIACMVTRDEHKHLGSSSLQGWARYIEMGIQVYDSLEKRWLAQT